MRYCNLIFCGFALVALAACGGDDEEETCNVDSDEGCEDGQVCEEVASGMPACFAPVQIRGRVFDAANDAAIAGATVIAVDANGGGQTDVVTTAADGTYSLDVPTPRNVDGTYATEEVTLRVSADGYQTFPTAPRSAVPIDLEMTVDRDGAKVVMNTATDVSLLPLPGGDTGVTVRGKVDHDLGDGVLVIAEQGDRAVATALSGSDGSFVLFNVPAGSTELTGYRAGLDVESETVDVGNMDVGDIVLSAGTEGLGTVSGSVNIVNAPGGSLTSVILVVESTFIENAARGEAPPGLRAAGISSAFSIMNVPPGDYVVLAAFENDNLVRDPDTSIGGTQIQHITVMGNTTLEASFKVTEALAVISPGADGLEVITSVPPTFQWADDSSEDNYEVRVFDAFGAMVHEEKNVPRHTGSGNVEYTWDGADLEPGMVYQFRVLSIKDGVPISATEDLRGVFQYMGQ